MATTMTTPTSSSPDTGVQSETPETPTVDELYDEEEEDIPGAELDEDECFSESQMAAVRRIMVEFEAERQGIAIPPDWHVRDFADAYMGDTQPPWVIKGYLLGESAALTSAQPHSLKSLSWLYACMEAPLKKKVFDHFDAANVTSSLFIETEDPEWLVKARIRGFAKGLGLSAEDRIPGFHFVCPGPFDLVAFETRLGNLLERYHPSFAVLSTLQNLLEGRDWAKSADMQPVNAAIIRLSRKFCPITVITHSPWDKKAKRAAGTVTQTANFIITTHFEKAINKKTGETFAHVKIDSKAGSVADDFTLKLVTEGPKDDPESVRRILFACEGWPRGLARDAVLAELAQDADAPIKEIAERAGVGVRYVQKLLKEEKIVRKAKS